MMIDSVPITTCNYIMGIYRNSVFRNTMDSFPLITVVNGCNSMLMMHIYG